MHGIVQLQCLAMPRDGPRRMICGAVAAVALSERNHSRRRGRRERHP